MKDNKNNFKKIEKKQFSITLNKELVDRIHHIKKISNIKGYDAYKSLDSAINNWVAQQEKDLNISEKDHKNISICPECASKLRICEGKKGKFIGCSSFPKCKYTASL